jgi:wyosine [tRNA(Phe)-imidazoG37] synthetase (radical SAM superfamily)
MLVQRDKQNFKYIYGPVPSWRLGRSLGIDPISQKAKICCFDCIYCQVGRKKPVISKRREFVPAEKIIEEIKALPKVKIDYITFSGSGEPTLAANIGTLIDQIKKIRKEKIAVITNSALLGQKAVRQQISKADLIMAKLDAPNNDILSKVNCPYKNITASNIITGIKKLRKSFKGDLALQIMFVEENKQSAELLAEAAKSIKADIIFINTPLRPSDCKPLSRLEISKIKKIFQSYKLKIKTVYDSKRKKVLAIDTAQTRRRRRLNGMHKRRIYRRK